MISDHLNKNFSKSIYILSEAFLSKWAMFQNEFDIAFKEKYASKLY